MNHLDDCFHCWPCASGSPEDYLLSCSNGTTLHDLNGAYSRIMNTLAYRDPENGFLAIGQWQVHMPHKCLWGMFKVPFLFNRCLDNEFRSASFDLQRLKFLILFTGHTSMAYDKSEWKIDLWLMKSTRHSLPSPWRPSTIVSLPDKQASVGSLQSLVEAVEHNISAIQETLITQWTLHAQRYYIV